jgi:hypothetical protein
LIGKSVHHLPISREHTITNNECPRVLRIRLRFHPHLPHQPRERKTFRQNHRVRLTGVAVQPQASIVLGPRHSVSLNACCIYRTLKDPPIRATTWEWGILDLTVQAHSFHIMVRGTSGCEGVRPIALQTRGCGRKADAGGHRNGVAPMLSSYLAYPLAIVCLLLSTCSPTYDP